MIFFSLYYPHLPLCTVCLNMHCHLDKLPKLTSLLKAYYCSKIFLSQEINENYLSYLRPPSDTSGLYFYKGTRSLSPSIFQVKYFQLICHKIKKNKLHL